MNHSLPEISIIIPVHNAERYLDRCILSVTKQTFSNFELLLVDDGSSDRSGEICDEWAMKDERIIAIHQTNGGSAKARNAGLQRASGMYIGFADSDDWLEPNMVQTMIERAKEHDSDLVIVGHYDDFQQSDGSISKEISRIPQAFSCDKNVEYRNYFPKLLKESCFFQVWDKLYRRELLERHCIRFDQSMPVGQDASFNIPLTPVVNRVDIMAVPLYHYSCREGSMSSITFKESYLQSRVRAFEWAESTLRNWCPQVIQFFANGCIDQMGNLAEGLYKNASYTTAYRDEQLNRIISNQTVQKCVHVYPPSGLRNRYLTFAIKQKSIILMKFYAKGILMLKSARNMIRRFRSR